ncbi:hypothetical protein [Methyloferula stellata]|uniref:hypothetical protein n=1 Tax=Methyloferula stellata TaxID=876270 RepID=UPI0012694A97|nr:hypothetical protein [Methyloferula stellata]
MPLIGNPPEAAFPGGLHCASIGLVCARSADPSALADADFMNSSTLACSFCGSSELGQCGVFENVSPSEAQVSNMTGDGCDRVAGPANSVNSRQMKASEFSVVPSTAPPLDGTATATAFCAKTVFGAETATDPIRASAGKAMTAKMDFVMAFSSQNYCRAISCQRGRSANSRIRWRILAAA